MSLTSDYLKRKKELEEEEKAEKKTTKKTSVQKPLFVNKTAALYMDNDIAPVKETKKSDKKDEERTWFSKGAFEDGWQFGDLAKTVASSFTDVGENVTAGILGIGEKAIDAGAYAVGGVGGLFGNDKLKDDMSEFIKKDLYNEEEIAKKIILGNDDNSVFGEKSDALMQSGGQLLGTIGLQAVGVPWFITSGVTGFGAEAEGALNEGASYGEAGLSAAISAGAEILTEKLFGGSGLGEKGLIAVDSLTKGISNKLVKALADYGVDVAAEGAEEVVSQFASNFASSLYKEENLKDILFSEEAVDGYIEAAIGGGVLGGVMNASNVVNSVRTGRDYRSGLTENEQKVVDKEYEKRLAEEDRELSKKEKDKIYNEVLNDLDEGGISIDTIEEVLGGERYQNYKSVSEHQDAIKEEHDTLNRMRQGDMTGEQLDRLAELKAQLKSFEETNERNNLKDQMSQEVFGIAKDSRLVESYNERGRRSQAFTADLSKYDTKQQEVIKKAVESGILNDTRRTHKFVDMIAKISADKGVLFDFANNDKLKESGFAIDGKTVNGFVTKDGVTLNIDSAKSLNTVVGHEITHVLEGTELYGELQSIMKSYAETKGEYESRRTSLAELYKDIEDADIDAELTADLVGDYLFTDENFINNLSTNHRNVFQKIYDEVKYLCKVATAGSKEARQLEKVKRAFEKAYKENGKGVEGTKYSVSPETDKAYLDAVSRGDTDNAQLMVDEAAKAAGYTVRAYHGTARGDRVGNVFLPERATSGPMAFFTDDKQIAENYSKSKQDTSIAYDPDYDRYETQFRIKAKDKDIALYEAWRYLPFDARRRITQKASQLREDWDGDNELILDPETNEANGGFQWQLKEARGNAIQALTEQWLNSGTLFNEEARFLDVLEMAGVTEEFKKIGMDSLYFKDPNAKHEKVYDTYLKINSPFDTANVDEQFIADLEAWYDEQDQDQYVRENMESDMWDKNGIDAYDFASRLRSDIENNTTHAWTSIPDSVTDYLKHLGYDGIKDSGGKYSGIGHTVWIPFTSEQVKSAENITRDDNGNVIPLSERFNPENKDIRYSMSDGEAPVKRGNYNLYGKDIALNATPNTKNVLESEVPAPVSEEVSPVSEEESQVPVAESELFPDDFAPMPEDTERLDSLTDEDAPPIREVPYQSDKVEAADPFYERDIGEVGNRKVKAYMYENPEVKPFFQQEAQGMLYDLRNSIKGEKWYNDEVYYETGGERGWGGTTRHTTDDIAELLDKHHYTYAEIEKGLKAIIEDHGAENNAVSKRIEFMLNDRLMYGYNDVDGRPMEPNQDYINLITEKQINEYSKEAFDAFMENADSYAPPVEEEIAPVAAPVAETAPVAPVKEKYEAIRPKREKQPRVVRAIEEEPRMMRVDSGNGRPGEKQRKWIGTSTDSEAVDRKVLPDDLDPDKINYQPIPNKVTLGKANSRLDSMGYDSAIAYFNSQFANKSVSLEDVALGERLIQEAIKRGDTKTAGELIQNVSILGTELGQKVQALSIIKRLTPEGQLKMLQKTVERGKTKGDKAFEGVEFTQEMTDKVLSAYNKDGSYDQKKLNQAVEDVKQEIADQMKVTMLDKVNAWRYLSMLGNPKTHIRNLVSNIAMRGTMGVKNAVARTIESVFIPEQPLAPVKSGSKPVSRSVIPNGTKVKAADRGNIGTVLSYDATTGKYLVHFKNENGHTARVNLNANLITPLHPTNSGRKGANSDIAPVTTRTRTWKAASEEVKSYARKTALEMKDIISGESRYNEAASIKDKRQIFQNKILNAVYEFNSDMLGKEDWWFSKAAYTSSLSEFLTANGIRTAQDIKTHPEVVEKARQYALEQSQIATFRQYSWLANKINEIEHRNTATNVAVGAIVPFKKTPINIAKTGLNYSPLGFAKTLTYDMSQVKNGKMEASEMIDHLAQNVTGSSLALIGYMLAQSGLLNGAGEDDKEGEYDYQLGEQAYSVNIGGATFSLSWLSPVAMPLFVGVNAYEQLVEGKEWNGDVVVETLAQTLDPLSEMSFISSLDSVLSSYDSGIQKFAGIGETMAQNYITQFAPTLMSQVATVMDDTKRSTKVSGDSDFKFVDQTINKLKYKIPFLRETLEPTTDIWGNEVKQTENIMARAFETFIAPYARREDIASDIDEEIKGLYSETGDTGLIPSIPYNYVSYDGEKYKMSAKDFTEFKKNYGQTAYDLMEDLFATDTYKAADAETKADYVNKVYDYARDEARKEYFAKFGVEFTNATEDGKEYYKPNAIKGAIENDVTPEEYTFSTKYPEKYKFLKDNGVSYSEYENGSDDFKDAYTWAYNNPDKFTLSKAVAGNVVEYRRYTGELYDIKADKDASGKSINGSRKEKVAKYINGLDLDYGARIILFKSEYNADDTYNYDIISYLNSREDISYKEMETILKELGFEVDSKGNISWD